jgi:hypothetical protein
MLIDELELDSFRVRCKFPKSIMMNVFMPLTCKYEHRFHIKCDDIRIHVVDETYDGEFMNLYYETDDDERVCVKDGMKIDVSLEIWNERGKRHFMNMTDESFDDIIYVTEQWIVENRHGINHFVVVPSDDINIKELLKPKWKSDLFRKKLKMETEPSVIDVDFIEVNDNMIEMKQ